MSDFLKQQKQKEYNEYVKQVTPTHSLAANMAKAFLTGGVILRRGTGDFECLQRTGDGSGGGRKLDIDAARAAQRPSRPDGTCTRSWQNSAGPEHLSRSPDLRILSRPRRSSIRRKDRCSESAARVLRSQDRCILLTEFSQAGCLE